MRCFTNALANAILRVVLSETNALANAILRVVLSETNALAKAILLNQRLQSFHSAAEFFDAFHQ